MQKIIENISFFEQKVLENFKKQKYIERKIYKDFDNTNFPIFWIVWLRWVWKTTYLLSKRLKNKKSLYISCDWSFLIWVNLLDLILYYYNNFDINTFYLDEIQFLPNYAVILKNIYDIGNINIVFSGSSKIQLEYLSYDLSRRVVIKKLPIFSYLEYLNIKHKQNVSWFSFDDLLKNYKQLSFEYSKYYSKDVWKNEYLEYGEFGYFYQWFKDNFKFLLWNTLKKSIYEDIPQIAVLDAKNLSKLEKMIFYIANMGASEISINSLSKKINLDNKITKLYIEYLEKLWWVYSIEKFWKLTENIRKEIKIYLSSNNLMYYLSLDKSSNFAWKIRETLFLQNIKKLDLDIFYKKRTDFVIKYNWKDYEFEIWWKNKKRTDNVFIVKDDILLSEENTIPLWLFTFLEKK